MEATTGQEENDTNNDSPITDNAKLCAGLDFIESRIRDSLLPPILHPNLFPANGPLRPPKGVLIHGPAGVGKSVVAAQFAQELMKESKIHVRTVQCADLLASTTVIGEAESMVSGIFEEAEMNATNSIGSRVILDDVHLICPRRGSYGSAGLGVDQLAGTLLALLGNNYRSIIVGSCITKVE